MGDIEVLKKESDGLAGRLSDECLKNGGKLQIIFLNEEFIFYCCSKSFRLKSNGHKDNSNDDYFRVECDFLRNILLDPTLINPDRYSHLPVKFHVCRYEKVEKEQYNSRRDFNSKRFI